MENNTPTVMEFRAICTGREWEKSHASLSQRIEDLKKIIRGQLNENQERKDLVDVYATKETPQFRNICYQGLKGEKEIFEFVISELECLSCGEKSIISDSILLLSLHHEIKDQWNECRNKELLFDMSKDDEALLNAYNDGKINALYTSLLFIGAALADE